MKLENGKCPMRKVPGGIVIGGEPLEDSETAQTDITKDGINETDETAAKAPKPRKPRAK